ncbi:uncharacterized protein LOC127123099 [Lathyrus oleraceus]|uniref:uncharacterized protein LOC127123099 n=1 Tax=Pisum sativum TaxID=3888 RepID=UPI0021D03FAD|nr:uncharacterized protein LOC127123099 [Pisum sativum]
MENPVPPQGNPPVQTPTATPCVVPPPVVKPPVIEIDYQNDVFFNPRLSSIYDAFGPPTAEVEKKVCAIEEKLKGMEGSNAIGLDVAEMCLVPSIIIPSKFKVPDFKKYKGESDPRTHIKAYCQKMDAYSDDGRLLMHFFQDSLSGASLEWYMQLEGTHIRSWKDMTEDLLKHFKYNRDMAPNHTQLQNLTQNSEETLKEYAQCWRELAARVQPPLLERELVDMFMGSL